MITLMTTIGQLEVIVDRRTWVHVESYIDIILKKQIVGVTQISWLASDFSTLICKTNFNVKFANRLNMVS